MGHFASALLPRARGVAVPLWLMLALSNLPDFLWFALALTGVEPTEPTSFLDVSLDRLHADMIFSHSAAVELGIAMLVAGAVFAWRRDMRAALWCGGLVVLHMLCDYASGFPHELIGRGSPMVGLGLYASAPHVAILVEAAFAAACVWYFARTKKLAPRAQVLLYAAFVGGALSFLPMGARSMREWIALLTL